MTEPEKPRPTSPAPSVDGSAILLAFAAGLIVLLGVRKVWDPDAWWQLATGKWILEHGLSSTEVLSLRQRGTPRTESSWLYCAVLAWIVARVGLAGAIVIKTAAMLGAFAAMAVSAIRAHPSQRFLVGVLCIIAAMASSQRFVLRPEFVSYFFWGVFTLLALDPRLRERRVVFAIIPLQAIWANTHSSFPLGLLPIGAWLLERALAVEPMPLWARARRPLAVGTLSLLACLATPNPLAWFQVARDHLAITISGGAQAGASLLGANGSVVWLGAIAGVLLVGLGVRWLIRRHRAERRGIALALIGLAVVGGLAWTVVGVLRPPAGSEAVVIKELVSPLRIRPGFVAVQMYWVLAAMGSVSVLLRSQTRWGPWMWLATATFALSLLAVRHIPFFALTAIPWLAQGRREAQRWALPAPRILRSLVAGIMTTFAMFQAWLVVTDRFTAGQGDTNQFGLGIARHCFPTQAGAWLERNHPNAGVFAPPEFGSYLLVHGLRPFVDTRWAAGSLEQYLAVMKDSASFRGVLRQPDIDVVVLKIEQVGTIAALMREPGWRILSADAESCVAARTVKTTFRADSAWFEGLKSELPPVNPAPGVFDRVVSAWPYQRMARFCELIGRSDFARYFDQQAELAWRSVGVSTAGNTDAR